MNAPDRASTAPVTAPLVTFVVPCYKLAHFLPECINSLLSQSFQDFEILIMDDCSPDNTPEVARSFGDPRVQHIRNEPNLGHLRNYNKGIGLARGKYVWLISADDCLRRPYALEHFVRLMRANPTVGYAFCPAIALQGGKETHVEKYSWHGDQDTVFDGREFLVKLLASNNVPASAGLVRKDCYEKAGAFQLDLPYAGDWFLWCVLSLHDDVGYIAEPMVNYRSHEVSMSKTLKNRDLIQDNLKVLWRIKREVEKAGRRSLIAECEMAIANEYAHYTVPENYAHWIAYEMSAQELDESLRAFSKDKREADRIRARIDVIAGDRCFERGDLAKADASYKRALHKNPFLLRTWAKYFLPRLGAAGMRIREGRKSVRQAQDSKLKRTLNAVIEPKAGERNDLGPYAGNMVSIIICTRNRSESLGRTLDCMGRLSSPAGLRWELLVVDNNSSDQTRQVTERFAASSGLDVHYIFEGRTGKSVALNTGIRNAKGDILAFTDDDMLPDTEWLVNISEQAAKHPTVALFLGQTKVARPGMSKIAIREGDSEKTFEFPCPLAELGAGNNMMCRKDVISAVGDFDPALGPGTKIRSAEDADFTYRIVSTGGVVRYFPQILAYHDHDRLDAAAIRGILFNYSIGLGALYCKHIFKLDWWATKSFLWELQACTGSIFRKGRTLSSIFRLAGIFKGFFARSVQELVSRMKGNRHSKFRAEESEVAR